jgi:hypothetical protein
MGGLFKFASRDSKPQMTQMEQMSQTRPRNHPESSRIGGICDICGFLGASAAARHTISHGVVVTRSDGERTLTPALSLGRAM